MAVPFIRESARKRADKEGGNHAEKTDQAKQKVRVCDPIDKPAHGYPLNPSADQ
jgi:hypothetical protein